MQTARVSTPIAVPTDPAALVRAVLIRADPAPGLPGKTVAVGGTTARNETRATVVGRPPHRARRQRFSLAGLIWPAWAMCAVKFG